MSYPAQSLAKVLDDIDRSMIAVRAIAERANERLIAGPVGSTFERQDWRAISETLRESGYATAYFERHLPDGSVVLHEIKR